MDKTYDFSGWATRNNVRCSDGRTIRKDAFKHNDGEKVPLVWNHNHKDADNVLGHALLENRDEGVYAYCSFNNTEQGQNAKELVIHGDITSLSIYANQLKQNGGDVIHGCIKEVSLVLAGANAGAKIETVIAHGDNADEEACIYNSSETLELFHNECEKDTELEHKEEAPESTKQEETKMENEKTTNESEKTLQDVVDTMSDEQKTAMYALIGLALEENNKKSAKEDDDMKHNLFDNEVETNDNTLSHGEFLEIVADAKKTGSLKEAFLAHGITNIENLFPEAQVVTRTPETVDRDTSWVAKVMNGVHHSPFSRVKSTYVDITADEARAKGYVKGNQKVQEVIAAFKRVTTPQTVYKLQKLDRDDVIDITDFDVVAYLKSEMRGKLEEEVARAILIGDGRLASDNDKINPLNIRPILGDHAVYTTAKILTSADAADLIDEVIKARKDYKGSGKPSFFSTEDVVTSMLLIKDTNGHYLYKNEQELATTLRVKEIITVEPMENSVRTDDQDAFDYKCLGIMVNLDDYNVGADKGGAVNMFDDFDLDVNKYEYLMETRCSGALIKPRAAVTFELKSEHTA